MPAFIGIDVGTLDVRGVLVSATGEILAQGHCTIAVESPAPGYAEHDPEHDWWDSVCAIIRGLLDGRTVTVAGVGVAGLFPVTCPLDQDGQPIGKAILYHDSRAEREVEEVARLSRQALTGDEIIPNMLWLARHRPADFSRVHTIVSSAGYVVYRLTDRAIVDPHNAYRFGGVADDTHLGWRLETMDALGLPSAILPDVAITTDVVGVVTSQASEATGLLPGTPVITGTTDTLATLVGNGVLEAGDAMIYYGSTGLLTLLTAPMSRAIRQPDCLGPTVPYYLAVYLLGSGAALRWARDLFTALRNPPDIDAVYCQLDAAAALLEPGAGGLAILPYFAGRLYPRPDSTARAHISGLSLQHQVGHLWRALLEAPGYVLATRLKEPLPHPVRHLIASGGGARSETWRQIISDMIGLPQSYAAMGSGALGVAFLAALGTGHVSGLNVVRESWLQDTSITRPNLDHVAMYRDLLPRWQALDAQFAAGG